MEKLATYKTVKLSEEYFKSFEDVYEDFRNRAIKDYHFELEPLEYLDFLDCISKNLMDCLILLENDVPSAFLISTVMISESIEINIIHCKDDENITEKRKALIGEFLNQNRNLLKEKVCTYPMLGIQNQFVQEITHYGFKLTGTAVVRFKFMESQSLLMFRSLRPNLLPDDYSIVSWSEGSFLLDAFKVIYESFKDSNDALFDPRFKSKSGVKDVVNKIVSGIYGEFLPECTQVLLYQDKPVGMCFCNITGGTIGNIPLIGIIKEHHRKNLGKLLLYRTMNNVLHQLHENKISLTEVNASVDTENFPAIRMYRYIGFKEDYYYPQAYTTIE